MHVDIIVPKFDDSSDDVILSTWYKNVGDKISKNEIIADAETPFVACGITSGYDCILAKILVHEGDSTTQGAKIAVLETDLNADVSEMIKEQQIAEDLQKSQTIEKNEEPDLSNFVIEKAEEPPQVEEPIAAAPPPPPPPPPSAPPAPSPEPTEEKAVEEEIKSELINEIAEETVQEDSLTVSTDYSSSEGSGYSLSVGGASSISTTELSQSEQRGEKIAEEAAHKEIKDERLKELAEEIIEEQKEGHMLSNKQLENDINEYREGKIIGIISSAENKAKEEAAALATKILDDSKKVAMQQSEEIKTKILHEYEERALKDASEMHAKIVQGSIAEAEKTRAMLIDEAKEKAQIEAGEIRKKIIETAQQEADKIAAKTLDEAITRAKEKAQVTAEIIAQEIIDKAREESNAAAREIKKDTIHSANKHATRESENIMKKIIQDAKKSSKERAKKMMDSTAEQAVKEVSELKDELLKTSYGEIVNSIKGVVGEVTKEACDRLKAVAKAEFEEAKGATRSEIQNFLKAEISAMRAELRDTQINDAKEKELLKDIKKIEKEDRKEKEIIRKLLHDIDESRSPEMYANNWNKPQYFDTPGDKNVPIDLLTKRINEKMKSSLDSSVVSTVSNEVDMSAVLAMEKSFGAAFTNKHNTRLGFTPFFITAAIAALKQYKVFNAHIRGDEIIYKNYYDISIITCGNDGVEAPVIRNADKMSIADLEKNMIALSRRAVEGTLSVEEVSGGTFTIVNAGIYGSLIGTDLLTPPQVATLSIHRMHNRPIATDNGVEVKPVLYISLSYDHRIADTKKASEFLSNVKSYVENPGWQILDL